MLTGGGDAPGLNAVIRAATRTAIIKYGWSVIGFEDGFEGCITGRYRQLSPESVRGILARGGTILGTSNRCNPFHFANAAAGEQEPRDHSQDVVARLKHLGVDDVIVIGGDGTLSIAYELSKLGVRAVGVPKTIDNDVRGTEMTFGFDTAVTTVTDALDKVQTTAESHHRVMVVEVMGRTAGWIALYAGIAGGANVILVPEVPFELDVVLEAISLRASLGRHFTIIVAAEGAAPLGQQAFYTVLGSRAHERRYGGIGEWLAREISQRVHQEVRALELGHLQRGGSPSPRDRVLGTLLGAAAVDLIAAGGSGQMVGVGCEAAFNGQPAVISVPLAEPSRGPRLIPANHALLSTARGMGISLGDPTIPQNGPVSR
ncbi:MAG: ATP-dependent 6-phosphofructokinase [Thermomicrobiales bacterium]|nr:ATP-dependent 6-phosphofructokinase [Thermomicrobiales bacterium]